MCSRGIIEDTHYRVFKQMSLMQELGVGEGEGPLLDGGILAMDWSKYHNILIYG